MKRLVALVLCLLPALAFAVPPYPTVWYREQTVRNTADIRALQAEVDATELVANAAIPAASFAQVDTNEVADATLFTPDFVGQLLIGSESNLVWVAVGATTNDWLLLTVTE
ncbi:MAG: hypothetical protein QM286_08625 [Acidobacteriota bacterium]|nr:hypothetical protein [Acidobacteriota bacterium]